MSDTPRTDSYVYKFPGCQREPRLIDFARQLERELAAAQSEVEHWKGECSDLVRMAHEMRAEIDYFQTLIDLQHKRTMEADKLWQIAHNKPDVWPDLGELIKWLVSEIENKQYTITCASEENQQLKESLSEARADIDALRMGKMSPCDYYTSKESEENLCRELAEAQAEIERQTDRIMSDACIISAAALAIAERDKLIEQMKTAMEAALKNLKMQGGSRIVIEDIETALSAAERMRKK